MTRLYLNQTLIEKAEIALSLEQSHHIHNVLRYKKEDVIRVFNETNGEWFAKIIALTKKQVIIEIQHQHLQPQNPATLWLAFAPLKQDANTFLLEKATELGVTHLQPLWMERSNTQRLNHQRWEKIVTEASQQCERQDIPKILESQNFIHFLKDLPSHVKWLVALERYQGPILSKTLSPESLLPYGFIVGPEGGFSPSERKLLESNPSVQPTSLGPRILRAETAALSVLAITQTMVL